MGFVVRFSFGAGMVGGRFEENHALERRSRSRRRRRRSSKTGRKQRKGKETEEDLS